MTVLFLSTDNYYRSRFTEPLFNSPAGAMRRRLASSRNLAKERGVNNLDPTAASAVKTLEALGVCAGYDRAPSPDDGGSLSRDWETKTLGEWPTMVRRGGHFGGRHDLH